MGVVSRCSGRVSKEIFLEETLIFPFAFLCFLKPLRQVSKVKLYKTNLQI
jgi:hypothetical protein